MLRLAFPYSPWKITYFTPVALEILNFKCKRQHLSLRNLVLLCAWEDAEAGHIESILYILAIWGL